MTDIELVQRFMQAHKINGYNTRLFKKSEGSYELRLASSLAGETEEFTFEEVTIQVTRGDYQARMASVVEYLQQTLAHCANENQKAMVDRKSVV